MTAIYPVFKRTLTGADLFNGIAISRNLKQLDELASSTNTTLLSRFIDSATMAREVLDDEQLAEMSVPEVAWYEPDEGLSTVRSISAAIRDRDIRIESRRGDETQACLNELEELGRLLISAVDQDNRFHLLVDI